MMEVLLVDDDALVRGLLAEWLTQAGYRVHHADNGPIALEMLLNREFGLLITDMDMPIGGGLVVIKIERRSHPRLRVIAMSSGERDDGKNCSQYPLKYRAPKTQTKPRQRQDPAQEGPDE